MKRFFGKLLNIRPDEWSRLILIYLMYCIMLTGLYWGEAIVEAAFLRQVGLKFLPLAIMGNAICSIVAIVVYAAFADRMSNDRLLIALMILSAIGIGVGLAFLGWGLLTVTYPILYLMVNVPLRDIFSVHWQTYVNGFYDTRAAKRIVPVIGSGTRVAGIVAGLTMPLLNHLLAPSGIVVVWMVAVLAMAGFTWLIPHVLGDRQPQVSSQATTPRARSSIENIREGYQFVSRSPFLRWMALVTLTMMILLAFVNYQTGKVLLDKLDTIEGISNFTGLLSGLSNLIALPFQLFLLSRLIDRIGLGNTALIFPVSTLLTCGGLIFAPGIPSAALGHLDRSTLRTALRNPIDSLLYNAVPLRLKGRARAFINGLVTPIGSLIGAALLLLPRTRLPLLATLIVSLTLVYLFSAWKTRRLYVQALIHMLEQEDFSFLLSSEASELIVTDPATLSWLRAKLEQPDASPELTIFMAQLVSRVAGDQATPILGQVARSTPQARTRSAVIDVLVAADVRDDAARQLYVDFLADDDGQVRQSAFNGLERLLGPSDEQFVSLALQMLNDPEIDVRVQVLIALTQSGAFYQLSPAVAALDQLLLDAQPHRRAQGVRVLGKTCLGADNEQAMAKLISYLADPADEIRLEASLALEQLPPIEAGPALLARMDDLMQDPVERVRQSAITILARLGTHQARQSLIGTLTDASPQIRAAAVDALVQVGKPVIPIVRPHLDSPNPQLRRMAAVVLSRIDPQEFGARIETHITSNLSATYRNCGRLDALAPCADMASMAILQDTLKERNQELIDEIFYLLTAIHPLATVKIVTESFHSQDSRVRANATEALEALTTPQTAQLIAPLFEPELPLARLLQLSRDTWDLEHPDPLTTIRQLVAHPDDPWLRTISTFTLGEIGASLSTPKRPDRRSAPADLFAALADEPVEPPTPSPCLPLTRAEIETMLQARSSDPAESVQVVARAAQRMIAGVHVADASQEEETLLSTIERIIFLKEVSFFEGMTIDQLHALANVCEEEFFAEDAWIFQQEEPGGTLYVVVSGRVAIEREGRRKGSFVRLATIEAHSYFGEMSLFDQGPRSAAARAIQDTLLLRLRREPLLALVRQHPNLSLELIHVLSQRLRESNDRIAELTRSMPRELHKLYDKLD